jgi:hypothetical protein
MSPDDLASEESSVIAEQVRRESFQKTVIVKDSARILHKTHKGEVEIFISPRVPEECLFETGFRVTENEKRVSVDDKKKMEKSLPPTRVELSRVESVEEIIARMSLPTQEISSGDVTLISAPVVVKKARNDKPVADVATAPDAIWQGKLHMHQVAGFNGSCHQAAGITISSDRQAWYVSYPLMSRSNILPAALLINGRIPIDRATTYLAQIQKSTSKELAIVEFTAGSEPSDKEGYQGLFDYFMQRQRYAVIGQLKDMYVIPVKKGASLPEFLEWIEGGERYERDVLMGVCVIEKNVSGV